MTELDVFDNWASSLNDGSKVVQDERTGLNILHVNSLPSFIQALGYVKCTNPDKKIFYRGQWKLFPTDKDSNGKYRFQPLALRNTGRSGRVADICKHLDVLISELRKANPIFKDTVKYPDAVLEGLLQQYGIPTTWFDVVDNIWVALWFACFKAVNTVKVSSVDEKAGQNKRSFIHMVRRNPANDGLDEKGGREKAEQGNLHDSPPRAYVLLLGEPKKRANKGQRTDILDLRVCLPSFFIRPHVQHGLLIRCRAKSGEIAPNMFQLIRGIVRMNLRDALEWLGEGRILTQEYMMPPPNYDIGFRELLNSEHKIDGKLHCNFPIYV